MKRQSGFTLIELIIVIVILGILAVTAAPQFFNFGADARTSTVRGMEGSVKAAAELVYSRSAINGVEGINAETVNVGGASSTTVAVVYGYPAATSAGIIAALNADIGEGANADNDWYYIADGSATPPTLTIRPRGQADDSDCYVEYEQASGTDSRSEVVSVVTGC